MNNKKRENKHNHNNFDKIIETPASIFKTLANTIRPGYKGPTLGQRAADKLAKGAGSWTFIITFFVFLGIWMATNGYFVLRYIQGGNLIDNYPFILLNLILSCLAAVQAPVILMSQNRAGERDRVRAEYDYKVNRKAEKEIQELRKQLNRIESRLK